MFKPKQKTLKQSLIAAVVKSVVIVGLFASAYLVSSHFSTATTVAPEHPSVSAEKPVAQDSPADLMQENDCWSGEAPKDMTGVVPGHVVTNHGLGGSRMVGQALEQIFEGKDHSLTVYGFCR